MPKNKNRNKLLNKHILITGGSSGIGLAIAEGAVKQGAHITLVARCNDKLLNAKNKISLSTITPHQKINYISIDVCNELQVSNRLTTFLQKESVPDIVINCAGTAKPDYFENISLDQFEQTIRLNLFGARNIIATLLPYMQKQKENTQSHIINVSSMAGLIGVFGYTDYCASKFALIGFSEALRSELKPKGIKVSVLCPPDTDTPGFAIENQTKPKETNAISKGASLMSSAAVADYLLAQLFKKQFLLIPGLESQVSYYAKRYTPRIVELFMDRVINKVQKRP